jgi:transcriptional regulator with XRE-family HTH domain
MARPKIGRGVLVPRLRYWRERAALNQRELAHVAGISESVVSKLEASPTERNADMATLRKLARALGVEPAALMSDPERGEGR